MMQLLQLPAMQTTYHLFWCGIHGSIACRSRAKAANTYARIGRHKRVKRNEKEDAKKLRQRGTSPTLVTTQALRQIVDLMTSANPAICSRLHQRIESQQPCSTGERLNNHLKLRNKCVQQRHGEIDAQGRATKSHSSISFEQSRQSTIFSNHIRKTLH